MTGCTGVSVRCAAWCGHREAEAEWKEGLLRNTATREDALEEYYCVPKNGGGTYIRRSLRERAARGTGKVLRFTGTPELTH
ncbi:hypothetical protein [Escherichia coli]|uniref:hypothetical protein n=1 Tax=Escherichia coli TaxID=562 RepID=UPI002FCCCA1F